ncbi:MAG TPA: nucleotide sugar dehydrogenase [Bacteroidetes bacterium]|jgi:UDP-N-acetyl-D-glucosamine/UDP-N-acetyl-D-galactosamine dehydrogenase|nr:MAG: hypothetical protein ABR94_10145 [Sphingobacteriales bacterium BACL12 MAG-120802-bin5]KRP12318.1 MAG: hypothetical protein ABR95_11710 [Sphingobacteriales bacterium BACL12 MAG-120813-bin55]HCK21861.1 nucleotide sugar dehydrogenase [Bacteroidota bacterium]
MDLKNSKIAVIGLGYVGLPLAVEFGKKRPTIGFDINRSRVEALKEGVDHTLEITAEDLLAANHLELTNDLAPVGEANVFIITVPTPVDKSNNPDLGPVLKASEMVAGLLKKGDVVIYESTVYPGCTEEECVPVLESSSGLTFNEDFYCGYSPERINPGDKTHTLTTIKKVTSGSTPEVGKAIDELYASIISAGTHLAPSIKVAEAAKVIENAQRDINIAFVNELAKIFNRLGIDTNQVLEASSTKWNFLPFKPGLVGGHCIGVDPYYLAQKAQQVGYHPEIILAGRRLNDSMGAYVVEEVVKLMVKKSIQVVNAKCLVLGFTFKENCPDVRNTKVIDIVTELRSYHIEPIVYDPWANPTEVVHEYGIEVVNELPVGQFAAVILAVAHKEFADINIKGLINGGVIYDVKGVLDKDVSDARL